ncbi:MAG: hypothetical protein HYU66_14950 [Armatimonadetes bacterium]|nr:hypothetical protein [Armatimonadota bacterium]
MRSRFPTKLWLMAPGLAAAVFAVLAILLPVGSDGLGAYAGSEPGVAPALGRWARDIHDGFWRRPAAPLMLRFVTPGSPAEESASRLGDHARARLLCHRGKAEEAVALYRKLGVLTPEDEAALFDLNDWLVVNGNYNRCEWYAKEADKLLGGGILRNNLAWHYTQVNRRAHQALDLALMSVAEDRNPCNVDTLAWAYFRNGKRDLAAKLARETLAFERPWFTDPSSWQEEAAQDSSRRLLGLLGAAVEQNPR